MFVIDKDENGKRYVRPAFIGFIKANWLRRSLMILCWPLTLAFTFFMNYVFIVMSFLFELVKYTVIHIRLLAKMPWNSEVWKKPRVK
jgi:hypothetical protein